MFLLSQPSQISLQFSILQLFITDFQTIFNTIKNPKSTLICYNMAFTAAQLTDLQLIILHPYSISVKVVKAKSHNSLMCAHAREGIFLKCKNVYTHFAPSLVAYFPIIILHLHHCSILSYPPLSSTIAFSLIPNRSLDSEQISLDC